MEETVYTAATVLRTASQVAIIRIRGFFITNFTTTKTRVLCKLLTKNRIEGSSEHVKYIKKGYGLLF